MRLRSIFSYAVFLPILSILAVAQSTQKSALLALSKQDHTLSIVDPDTLNLVAPHSGGRRSA